VPKNIEASGQQKFRLVDYRKLNKKTVGNAYPLPDITEVLDQLGQAKYFSCLDLAMGYPQIDMDPNDIDKTSFSTKERHWTYKRMPLVLKTAPATFKRMMNNVLSGLTGTTCFVFLDIVIYAKSLVDHDNKLRDLFRRLRIYNLKLQPYKCGFLRKEVNFPGAQNFKARSRARSSQDRIYQEFRNTQNGETAKEFTSFSGVL